MANAIYPIYKNSLMSAASNASLDQNDATNGRQNITIWSEDGKT